MELDPEQLEELRETFEYNDADGDGRIEMDEFIVMLQALEAHTTLEEARIGFDEIDTNGDGKIDFDEFVAWWSER
jgi:calmodulin